MIGRTFREWEKERRECEVQGLGARSGGCSFSVIVDLYVNGILGTKKRRNK